MLIHCSNVNTSVIAAKCLMVFGVCEVVEAVATRKDRFVKRFVLNSSVVCEICTVCSYKFVIYLISNICYATDFGE